MQQGRAPNRAGSEFRLTGSIMYQKLTALLCIFFALSAQAEQEHTMFSTRSMSVELASKAAWQAMLDCRKQGYSVAVAVVDRGGNL